MSVCVLKNVNIWVLVLGIWIVEVWGGFWVCGKEWISVRGWWVCGWVEVWGCEYGFVFFGLLSWVCVGCCFVCRCLGSGVVCRCWSWCICCIIVVCLIIWSCLVFWFCVCRMSMLRRCCWCIVFWFGGFRVCVVCLKVGCGFGIWF